MQTGFASLVQSTLVISTSLISNNRLSRCENLVPGQHVNLTTGNTLLWKRGDKYSYGEIVPLFHCSFDISLT